MRPGRSHDSFRIVVPGRAAAVSIIMTEGVEALPGAGSEVAAATVAASPTPALRAMTSVGAQKLHRIMPIE